MSTYWFSAPNTAGHPPIGLREPYVISEPINWRWKLWLAADVPFEAEAFVLASSTAQKLAQFLPAEDMPDVPRPEGDDGGTAGPAELGIPVSWIRKRSN